MPLKPKGTQTIETDRLILRRFLPTDAEDMFCNFANDEAVSRFLSWKPHKDLDVTKKIITQFVEDGENPNKYHWAIVPKELGKVAGSIGAGEINEKARYCDIGYVLGRMFWNRGFMTEALKAVIHYMIFEVGMNRVEALCDPKNNASARVMEHCGMTYEGTLRQTFLRQDGVIADLKIYSVLAQELG